MIAVEVVYALPEQQTVIAVTVPEGCTVQTAICQSGILQRFPSIDLAQNSVGIFGHCVALTEFVKAGDRIEIYRPLRLDPKEARRLRQKNLL